MTEALNARAASISINGTTIEVPTVAQCHCCASVWRDEIDTGVIARKTYGAIVDGLPHGCGISERNVGDHVRHQHVPLKDAAIESVRALQAEQRGNAFRPVGHATDLTTRLG